uniref:Uncharacterized protein n=1 Tax=Glossina pallidipes TaxID=7398 RepID=A0A1B0AAM4_GLOPL
MYEGRCGEADVEARFTSILASIKGNLSKGDIKNGFAVLVIVLGVLAKVAVIGVTKLEFCGIFFFVVSAVLILFVVRCFIAIAECKSKSAPVAVGVMTTVIISDVVGFLLVFADVGFALVCPLRVAFNFGFIEAAAVAVAIAVTVEFLAFMVKSGGGSVLMTSLNGSGVVISTKRDIIRLKSSKGSLGTKPPSVFVGVSVKFDAKIIGTLCADGGKGLKVEFTFPFVETIKGSTGIILGFNGFTSFNASKEASGSLLNLLALALIWKISVADATSTGNIGFVCVKLNSSVVLVQIPDDIGVEVSTVVNTSVVVLTKSTTSVDKFMLCIICDVFCILLLSSASVSEDPNNKSKKLIPLVVCATSTAASVVVCKGMGLGVDCKPSTSKSSLSISLLLLSINSKPSRRVSKKLFSVEPEGLQTKVNSSDEQMPTGGTVKFTIVFKVKIHFSNIFKLAQKSLIRSKSFTSLGLLNDMEHLLAYDDEDDDDDDDNDDDDHDHDYVDDGNVDGCMKCVV